MPFHAFVGILANCLLYCVRYDDTEIWTNTQNTSHRIISVNIKHIPYVTSPLMFLSREGRKLPCEKLAIIYRKPSERQAQADEQDDGNGGVISGSPVNQRIRKISRSISIENNLMQQINLLAVVPAL